MRPPVRCLMVVLSWALAVGGEPDPQFGLRFNPREARGETMDDGGSATRPQQEGADSAADSAVDAATSYSTMVLHVEPDRPRYKTVRVKTVKHLGKPIRQPGGNYKIYKNVGHETQTLSPTLQVPSSPHQSFSQVDPSVMQNLMRQQPQTFDVPENDEQDSSGWRASSDRDNNPSTEQTFKAQFEAQGDSSSQELEQNNGFDTKRPIYVPNRVSVQNPSADSSFNVGYSIGFGNGLAHSGKGAAQPPVGLRKGKVLSFPMSYQNTPVNLHIDGTNSVWKNMGSGVEMSENLDNKETPYSSLPPVPSSSSLYSQDETTNSKEYSSGSVVNQPIFYREGFEQSSNRVPSGGRSSFDHDHALQQSNTFDFSNAIDPVTNLPYSVDPSSSFFAKPMSSSFPDSFPKQSSSFVNSSPKKNSFSDAYTSKHAQPSFGESSMRQEFSVEPQYSHFGAGGENYRYESISNDEMRFAKPNFPPNTLAPLRAMNSLSINAKPNTLEFSKHYPITSKHNYNLKPFGGGSFNHVSEDSFRNSNFGFGGIPVLPPMFESTVKPAPTGMVQAFLVPVNPAAPMHYPLDMPVVHNGYSPFQGHPFGIIRIPEPIAAGSTNEEYEASSVPSGPHSDSHYSQKFHKSQAKIPSHFSKYSKDGPPESSQYFLQRAPYTHLHREESPSTRHHPAKFNRGPPDHSSEFKSAPPSPSYSSPEFSASSPPVHIQSHPSRPHRNQNMIIVKRA